MHGGLLLYCVLVFLTLNHAMIEIDLSFSALVCSVGESQCYLSQSDLVFAGIGINNLLLHYLCLQQLMHLCKMFTLFFLKKGNLWITKR